MRAQAPAAIEGRFRVGERVEIVPNHSCLTVAHYDEYVVVEGGEQGAGSRVVGQWKIERAR